MLTRRSATPLGGRPSTTATWPGTIVKVLPLSANEICTVLGVAGLLPVGVCEAEVGWAGGGGVGVGVGVGGGVGVGVGVGVGGCGDGVGVGDPTAALTVGESTGCGAPSLSW